jgi:hypothetical protein
VSERRLEKYWPGDVINVVLHIQHSPMKLKGATALFLPEGRDRGGMLMRGEPSPSADQPHLQSHGRVQSEAWMSAVVTPDFTPGIYRLNRVTVTTYGGRKHGYSEEELGDMASLRFEIVEEPEERPAVAIGFAQPEN